MGEVNVGFPYYVAKLIAAWIFFHYDFTFAKGHIGLTYKLASQRVAT